MVAPRVYDALRQPIVGHLDPYFFEVVGDVRKLLGYVFSTSNEFNVAISGTGTSGMETAVANFVEPGSKFAVVAAGYFADRLSEVGCRHGATVVRLEKAWGEFLTLGITASFLPWELFEVFRRLTWIRVGLLTINILVFVYLLRLVIDRARRRAKFRKT